MLFRLLRAFHFARYAFNESAGRAAKGRNRRIHYSRAFLTDKKQGGPNSHDLQHD